MRAKFVLLMAVLLPVGAFETPAVRTFHSRVSTRVAPATGLWEDRGAAIDVFHGAGGKAHEPQGTFTFVKEESSGTAPKFEVVDGTGAHWLVKLGEEVKSETAATRLLWAAGYYTDEDYYVPELRVVNLAKLQRGGEFVRKDGVVPHARFERIVEGQKRLGNWSWFENEHSGTREMSGLRVLMALINNWDLKKDNNSIAQLPGSAPHYLVSDLGATFGRTGNSLMRSKSNVWEYRQSKFLQHADPELVDFHMSSRPFFLTIFHLPNYAMRTKMQKVAKDIPRDHAKWMGEVLGRLSTEQIRDCFRAGGYPPDEVDEFAGAVQSRIATLKRL